MHYGRYYLSVNGESTIIPTKNTTAFIGQRITLSSTDIFEIQRYYNCALSTTTSSVERRFASSISVTSISICTLTMINIFFK